MNIYINTSNLELLGKEKNKSGLINRLLAEYYGHDYKHDYEHKPVPKKIIKTPKEAKEAISYKKTSNWGS